MIMSGKKTGGSYINTLAATQIRFCAFTVLKIKTFNFKNSFFFYQGSFKVWDSLKMDSILGG